MKVKVCPFPNIRSNNHEIISCSQLTIIWRINTNKGRTKNGIKCITNTDKSRRENELKCKRHNNRSRTWNGIQWGRYIDRGRTKNKIRCKKTTWIIEECIKKSIQKHELKGISYSSRFRKMEG
jgi:hypothetical protein